MDTRPLPDRIKQSLFDWLGQDLSGQRVADICAGSGTFGLEAASRGATEVTLIEAGRHAAPALQANLKLLGQPAGVHLALTTFQLALPRLRGLDLIFADPPFPWFREDPAALDALMHLAADSLTTGGRLVIRGERGHDLPPAPPSYLPGETRFYGRSWVRQLRRRAPAMPIT
jgi:16S rRNA (guanine(966)-N(2))-methyltransferase RsmD